MSSIIASFIQAFNYKEIVETINAAGGKAGWKKDESIDQYVTKIWKQTQDKKNIIFKTAYKKAIKRIIKGACKQSLKEQIDGVRKLGELVEYPISSKEIKRKLYDSLNINSNTYSSYGQVKEALKKTSYCERTEKLEEIEEKSVEGSPRLYLVAKLSRDLGINRQAIFNELSKLDKKDISMLCNLYKELVKYSSIDLVRMVQHIGGNDMTGNMPNVKEVISNIQGFVNTPTSLDKCKEFMQFLMGGKNPATYRDSYLIRAFYAFTIQSSI